MFHTEQLGDIATDKMPQVVMGLSLSRRFGGFFYKQADEGEKAKVIIYIDMTKI